MSSQSLSSKAFLYMGLLALQFGLQPILTRKFTPNEITRTTVVLAQEAVKLVMAFFMLRASGQTKQAFSNWTLRSSVTVAFIPAALYAVQNMCALMAYQNLDALTYNVLNQTKTLSAALCCYLVMGRKQSKAQVIALVLLVVAALIVEGILSIDTLLSVSIFQEKKQELQNTWFSSAAFLGQSRRHWTHGVLPILAASLISGLTGALTQRSLQSADGGRNPYLFSMELCVGGLFVLLANLAVSPDGTAIAEKGFFYGWTIETIIPVITNAAGGIIVGLVTKYAGSVRKGFALIFGLLFSGIFQAFSSSAGLSMEHLLGGGLAALSLYLHAAFPYAGASMTGSKDKKD